MFNERSGLVILWVNNVKKGIYTREQVPNLSNLRTVVFSVLDSASSD